MKLRTSGWVLLAILLAVAVWLFSGQKSMYSPVETDCTMEPNSIMSSTYNEDCTAGLSETDGYYSKNLTPGGYCDMQEKVKAMASCKMSA